MFRIRSVREVVFGWNSVEALADVVKGLGGRKVLVITGRNVGRSIVPEHILPALQGADCEVWDLVVPDPDEGVAEDAMDAVREGGYDTVIGVGGGSAMDIAKIAAALAHSSKPLRSLAGMPISRRDVRLILCPTTAGTGSEVTDLAVIKLGDMKHVFEGWGLMADCAVVDPALTLSLPESVTLSTGLDALCHAMESFVSVNASPFTDLLALDSTGRAARNLRVVVMDGSNRRGREEMSLASMLAGVAICNAGTVLAHALGYAHSHIHGMPHGISVAVTMPYVLQYNAPASRERHVTLARILGGDDSEDDALQAGRAFAKLLEDLGVPANLSDLGVEESDIPEIVDRIFMSAKHVLRNPRPVRRDDMHELVRRAIHGELE